MSLFSRRCRTATLGAFTACKGPWIRWRSCLQAWRSGNIPKEWGQDGSPGGRVGALAWASQEADSQRWQLSCCESGAEYCNKLLLDQEWRSILNSCEIRNRDVGTRENPERDWSLWWMHVVMNWPCQRPWSFFLLWGSETWQSLPLGIECEFW